MNYFKMYIFLDCYIIKIFREGVVKIVILLMKFMINVFSNLFFDYVLYIGY